MEPPLHGVAASPPIRPRHDRYLSFSYSPPSSGGDELTEDDIFDTPAEPESSPPHPHPHPQLRHHHKHFGILAALPASETRSVFNHKASASASVASSVSSTSSTSSALAIPSIHHRRPPARGKLMQQSAPVDVPVLARRRGAEYASEGEEEEEEEGGEVQMLPPHEMVAARDSPVVACSVLEGAGRTLKGRDLRRVRNAVFRKTGFID